MDRINDRADGPYFVKADAPLADKSGSMKRPQRQLVLNKGAEKYIFRYEQGREDELLDALIEQAKDKRTDFDWFDAAVISFKLTQSLIGCAEQLLREGDPKRDEGCLGTQDKDVGTIP
jgi:hypothetical protein